MSEYKWVVFFMENVTYINIYTFNKTKYILSGFTEQTHCVDKDFLAKRRIKVFNNIGGKIKTLAQSICAVGIIGSVIGGTVFICNEIVITGIVVLVCGSLLSWVGSLGLYGFGHLIENTDILVARGEKNSLKSEKNEENVGVLADGMHKEVSDGQKSDNKNSETTLPDKNNTAEPEILDSDDDELVEVYCPQCGRNMSFTKGTIRQKPSLICPFCYTKFECSFR